MPVKLNHKCHVEIDLLAIPNMYQTRLPNNLFMNHSTNEYLFIKVFILEGIVGSVKRYNLEN